MGLVDWFKRGVGEMMIARPDDAKSQVVWKHPDRTIPMKSQLTVEADEKAVFFRDGKVVATLAAGRHTLDASNLPFLSDLVDSFTGGNVFITEVFFVSIREHTGIKFGGRVGHLEDPKSGIPVETMVHGKFSFKVDDPEALIVGLVGMGRAESYTVRSWMKEQVLKVIRDRIGELLVKNKWPLLDVTSGAYTEEVETDVLNGMDVHVGSYGVQIVRLGNFVIDIDEEDGDNLKRLYTDAAYLRTVGGVGAYKDFAAGKAMMGAGEGMAKGGGGSGGGGGDGGMMAGASLGIGLGMAQMIVRDQQGGSALVPAVAGVVCGSCMASVPPGKFCSGCGGSLKKKEEGKETPGEARTPAFCVSCGSPYAADARFCGQCGTSRTE
ncbi:MAG: membrane protease subunit (stomatin/prohibitin family) [Planctomycetota bacterium]|jgi:membrane protease subunit (stomatin/prohibitin family)